MQNSSRWIKKPTAAAPPVPVHQSPPLTGSEDALGLSRVAIETFPEIGVSESTTGWAGPDAPDWISVPGSPAPVIRRPALIPDRSWFGRSGAGRVGS